MALIVQKFGGSSVANINRIKKVAEIIALEKANNSKIIVIISAMSGTTNMLISKCTNITKIKTSENRDEYDAVISTGETVSAALLALALQHKKIKALSIQGWQLPIKTNDNFNNALVENINTEYLFSLINKDIIPVITGFQGINKNARITTLGKGGSDITAALITAATKADRCDIYTDVDGIYTADPRIIHNAKKINFISVKEIMELSASGAKVLHPRATLAALRYKFDIRILSSFVKTTGTIINYKNTVMENKLITAITSNKNLINIKILYKKQLINNIISQLDKSGLVIDQIHNQSSTTMNIIASLTDKNLYEYQLSKLQKNNLINNFSINVNIASVSLVGYYIKNDSTIIWQIIHTLTQHNIEILSIYSFEIRITIMLNDYDTEKTIKILYKKFLS